MCGSAEYVRFDGRPVRTRLDGAYSPGRHVLAGYVWVWVWVWEGGEGEGAGAKERTVMS